MTRKPVSSCRPSRSLAALWIVPLALSSTAFAGLETQDLPLAPEANDKMLGPISQPHPEPDWNCLDSGIVGTGLRAIIPNDQPDDPGRVRQMLRVTKALVPDTLLVTTGPIGAAIASGEAVGFEYDIWPNDDGIKPDWELGQCLPIQGILLGFDENGEYGEIGVMYCFNALQYEQRVFSLQAKPHEVWLGPVIHTSDTGVRSLVLSGSANEIYGDLRSNGTIKLGGAENVILDDAFFAGLPDLHGGPLLGGLLEFAAPQPLEQPLHDAEWYRLQAVGTATAFEGDVTLINDGAGALVVENTMAPVEGTVVHATGSITVEGSGISANVSLVAGTTIYIACIDSTLQAAHDDLLAYSISGQTSDGVYLTGSDNTLFGAIHVPNMCFRLFGSGNDCTGVVRAQKVKVLGSENRLDDGTRPADPSE